MVAAVLCRTFVVAERREEEASGVIYAWEVI
jgi:hypothetical protein